MNSRYLHSFLFNLNGIYSMLLIESVFFFCLTLSVRFLTCSTLYRYKDPFGIVDILDFVHSGSCQFEIVSIWDCIRRIVSIGDCIQSGSCSFGIVSISGLCLWGMVSVQDCVLRDCVFKDCGHLCSCLDTLSYGTAKNYRKLRDNFFFVAQYLT